MRELANKILTRTDRGYLTKSVTNGFKHIWNHHLVDLNMPVGCPAYSGYTSTVLSHLSRDSPKSERPSKILTNFCIQLSRTLT